jgi:hypothetical protein
VDQVAVSVQLPLIQLMSLGQLVQIPEEAERVGTQVGQQLLGLMEIQE